MSTNDVIAAITETGRQRWDRCAPTYETDFEALTGLGAVPTIGAAGVTAGSRLLDVGCGPGAVIAAALAVGAEVAAIDVSQAMVDRARQRFAGCDIRRSDAAALPFEDGCFDAVTFGLCLHHMAAPDLALAEARRVLRPGGRVAFTVWANAERLEAIELAFAALGDVQVAKEAEPPPFVDTTDDAIAVLTTAGFADASARVVPIAWTVADGAQLHSGFIAYLGLGDAPEHVRDGFRARLDAAVAARRDATGYAVLPNPVILASGRRPA
jgi:SAM-dependent methyltransferase